MTRGGQLDREITIERKSVSRDANFGTEVVSWVPLAYQAGSPAIAQHFAAQIQDPLPSRSEAVAQGLVTVRRQTRLRMRYRNDIDSSMRVTVHGDSDVIYQIVGGPAMIGGRQQFLELMLEEYSS